MKIEESAYFSIGSGMIAIGTSIKLDFPFPNDPDITITIELGFSINPFSLMVKIPSPGLMLTVNVPVKLASATPEILYAIGSHLPPRLSFHF